jgi:hypothetical protein
MYLSVFVGYYKGSKVIAVMRCEPSGSYKNLGDIGADWASKPFSISGAKFISITATSFEVLGFACIIGALK